MAHDDDEDILNVLFTLIFKFPNTMSTEEVLKKIPFGFLYEINSDIPASNKK
jgi:hypothetical protein